MTTVSKPKRKPARAEVRDQAKSLFVVFIEEMKQ